MMSCLKTSVVRVLAVAALWLPLSAPASAQDLFALFQQGFGAPSYGEAPQGAYDRNFVRDWEMNPPKGHATLSKSNIEPTRQAITRYEAIVAAGGWSPVPHVTKLEAGMKDAAVPFLRARLTASGEYRGGNDGSTTFDLELEKGVKRFQAANGLTPTGIVDKRTAAALNIPAATRLKQLKVNLPRLEQLSAAVSKRYVAVNIPAAQIEAVENDQIYARYAGVVGKPDRPTPLLRSVITDLNFNPVWRMPPTVESEDLIPRGREMQRKGQNVMHKYQVDAYDSTGKKVDPASIDWEKVRPGMYTYSQQPGKENPLGFVKINFANAHSVYMHDTPSDTLFGRNFRSASSGCIRVRNVAHLVQWLLQSNPGWDETAVADIRSSGKRQDVRLNKPVDLHFVYVTAWATPDGVVQFRRDLYQRDSAGDVASNY